MSLRARQAAVREAALARTLGTRLGAVEAEIVALVCNGCGRNVRASSVDELEVLTAGWVVAGELGGRDFCGACAPARSAA